MATLERTVERREHDVAHIKRTSWGAIFAGTFVALGVMLLLATFGIAVGATTIEPATGDTPGLRAFGIGAGIWWLLTGILALLAGGFVAGRLSGLRRRWEGPVHGIVTWALTGVITVALMTSALGWLVGGAMRVIGATLNVAGQGVVALGGAVAGAAPTPDVTWQQVQSEAQQLLGQTDTQALQPGELREQVQGGVEDVQQAIPQGPDAALDAALANLREAARYGAREVDREAVVNVLMARTDMSREEARRTVDQWANTFQQAWAQRGQVVEQAQQAGAQAAETAAHAVAVAAWWTFFYFLLTAAAAALGGFLGAPRLRTPAAVVREPLRTEPVVPPQAPPRA